MSEALSLRYDSVDLKTRSIERIQDRAQPRIVPLPAYFRVTLEDEMNRYCYYIREQERMQRTQLQAKYADFKPYNWLEDSQESEEEVSNVNDHLPVY